MRSRLLQGKPFQQPLYRNKPMRNHFQAQGKVLLCGDFNAFIDPQVSAHVFGQSPLTPLTPLTNHINTKQTKTVW